jgi:hypothetical protein
LKDLFDKKSSIENAVNRANVSLEGLETYLRSLEIEHLAPSNLHNVVNNYDMVAEEQDVRIADLKDELAETDEAISVEKARLSRPVGNPKLNLKVSTDLFTDFQGAVKLGLTYGESFFCLICLLLLI